MSHNLEHSHYYFLTMFLTRTLPRTLPRVVTRSCTRAFTSDSHDDFKPKRTVVKDDDALDLIQKQIEENPVMLYMKGTPSQPQCGFSLQTVRILNAVGVDFASVNVLDYPAIREGIKTYS